MDNSKKISRVFRLAPTVVEQLDRRSKVTGITRTRILENALALYFTKGMREDMAKASKQIASFNADLGQPSGLYLQAA